VEVRLEERRPFVDLQAEVRAYRDALASRPGARFGGAAELATPTGPAWAVRALFDDQGLEERRVLMEHPAGFDLLTFTVRYPSPTSEVSRARLLQLLDLVTAVEPFES